MTVGTEACGINRLHHISHQPRSNWSCRTAPCEKNTFGSCPKGSGICFKWINSVQWQLSCWQSNSVQRVAEGLLPCCDIWQLWEDTDFHGSSIPAYYCWACQLQLHCLAGHIHTKKYINFKWYHHKILMKWNMFIMYIMKQDKNIYYRIHYVLCVYKIIPQIRLSALYFCTTKLHVTWAQCMHTCMHTHKHAQTHTHYSVLLTVYSTVLLTVYIAHCPGSAYVSLISWINSANKYM